MMGVLKYLDTKLSYRKRMLRWCIIVAIAVWLAVVGVFLWQMVFAAASISAAIASIIATITTVVALLIKAYINSESSCAVDLESNKVE